jgi:hypothetical protein
MAENQNLTLGDKLQALPKTVLFAILLIMTTVPLFFGEQLSVPNKPDQSAIDFYTRVMELEEGSTILISSDWTNSTRGESGGHFEALMRILMRKNIKFAVYTTADPQAPQVAQDAIGRINLEREKAGEPRHERWEDWVNLGFLPNAEAATNSIGTNFRATFANKQDIATGGGMRNVFQSPVLENIHKVEDFPLLIVITASKTSTIVIERLNGKLDLAFMVTGVMGPETQVYYASGQLVGMAAGLKGVYDIETMMENGVNNAESKVKVVSTKSQTPVAGFPGMQNAGKGSTYYPTLHFALTLMILAVVIGNVGMMLSKRGAR